MTTTTAELGPLSREEAHALAQARLTDLAEGIQAEQRKFCEERDRVLGRPASSAGEDAHRRAYLAGVYDHTLRAIDPMMREREYIYKRLSEASLCLPVYPFPLPVSTDAVVGA